MGTCRPYDEIAGNIVAISQNNIKHMLAYSVLLHTSYILVAMVTAGPAGMAREFMLLHSGLCYKISVAFGMVILFGRKGEENFLITDYRGIGFRHPWPAAAMAVFMFSWPVFLPLPASWGSSIFSAPP